MADYDHYVKTKLGQHNFAKQGCSEFCKIDKKFCPLKDKSLSVKRWTDLMNEKINKNKTSFTFNKKGIQEPLVDLSNKSNENKYNAEIGNIEFTCWGDGSGFEYDQMSRNKIGRSHSFESIYDIGSYQIEHKAMELGAWNSWIEKFQYDYRFGRVSDTNAQCVLFPNVDNPWMFTEYVFRGIGGSSDKTALKIPDEYVVQPPLYSPTTLELVNPTARISNPENNYDKKYQYQEQYDYDKNETREIRQNRIIANWDDLKTFSQNEIKKNKKLLYSDSTQGSNAGVKLYRAKIPVQSIKWGEHGNVPPHAIDMTAPADWLDPTKAVSKIKLVTEAVLGSPFYATKTGAITWENVKTTVYNPRNRSTPTNRTAQALISEVSFTSNNPKSGEMKVYTYAPNGSDPYKENMPTIRYRGNVLIIEPTTIKKDHGDYCHNGCSFCVGTGTGTGGQMICTYIRNLVEQNLASNKGEIDEMNGYFDPSYCTALHEESDTDDLSQCPHYLQQRYPLISSYQMQVSSTDQQANQVGGGLAYLMMGGMAGVGGMAAATEVAVMKTNQAYDILASQIDNLSTRGQTTITYDTHYQIVNASKQSPKLNKSKYNEFGKGVQILPDTGKYAFESEENSNPFSGGDTNAYGDISTRSFPVLFQSVMHCATRKDCNEVTGITQSQGFQAGKKAGGEGSCRYYTNKDNGSQTICCPYNGVSKRAKQFLETWAAISPELYGVGSVYTELLVLKKAGQIKMQDGKWYYFGRYAFLKYNGYITMYARQVESDTSETIGCCSEVHGASLISKNDKKTFHIKTLEEDYGWEEDFVNKIKKLKDDYMVMGQLKVLDDKVVEEFFWYQPLTNNNKKLTNLHEENVYEPDSLDGIPPYIDDNNIKDIPFNLRQHVDGNGLWFCKANMDVVLPDSSCDIIDNEQKFIGGWHPEYKDYSKRGKEFIQDVQQDISREGQAMGDYVHTGDYTPIPNPVNKKGYWIDASGVYVTDERSTGIELPIAAQSQREEPGNHGVCISFMKSNTEVDGQTGKRIQPKTVQAAVYSNDPYNLLQVIYKTGHKDSWKPRFQEKNSDDTYYAPCRVINKQLLPTMRKAIHCPKCDYYLSFKYVNIKKCPWCGNEYELIEGSKGEGLNEGSIWDSSAKVLRKFFKLGAMGNVDVWALPGTSIKTDAYFWRHQAQITNALKKQIKAKIGDKGKTTYLFNGTTKDVEFTLGYPESIGVFQKVPNKTTTSVKEQFEKDKNGKIKKDKNGNPIIKTTSTYNYDQNVNRYSTKYINWSGNKNAEKTGNTENTDLKYNYVVGSYNPIMPRHMIPGFYNNLDTGQEDQGVIAPYTDKYNDALKIATLDEMFSLRNQIQPMTAYIMKPSPTDFPTFRASYDQRQTQNQPIIYRGRKATIPPAVLAATDDGVNSYQQYYSGDMVYGVVTEYFPSGYTWWYMKNVIGGRITSHKGGRFHMDDSGPGAGYMQGGSGGLYTRGNQTTAYCILSLYGMLPLDKQIVKAYIIVNPSSEDPSKNPVGKSWTGGPIMYHHYHAFTQKHRSRNDTSRQSKDYQDGFISHLHGTAGFPDGIFFDENGDKCKQTKDGIIYLSENIQYQDESNYTFWGQDTLKPDDDRFSYYDTSIYKQMITNIAGLYDTEFYRHVGTPKKAIKDKDDNEFLGYGYDEDSFPLKDGFQVNNLKNDNIKRKQKYQYFVIDENNNIVLKYPETAIWKNKTTEQLQEEINNYTTVMQFGASNGKQENNVSYNFTQTSDYLYAKEIPEQSQSVPGYFDLSWTNSRGYVYDKYKVETKNKVEWNAPVIFQDSGDFTTQNYSGTKKGSTQMQEGTTQRILEVTDMVKSEYNNRVTRDFVCKAGVTYSQIKDSKYYSIKTQGTDIDDDMTNNNNKSDKLTIDYAYPNFDGQLNVIPEISVEGDKYELNDSKTLIIVAPVYPIIITPENCGYTVKIGKDTKQDSLEFYQGSLDDIDKTQDYYIDNYGKFEKSIKIMFNESVTITRVSSNAVKVESKEEIEIIELPGGYTENQYKSARIIECTNFVSSYHPASFLSESNDNSKGWRFQTYNNSPQYFVVDLFRAPLCKEIRGYRYEKGYTDYSNAKCPNESCEAHTKGCSIAANMNKPPSGVFNGKTSTCPLCNNSLSGAPGTTIVAGDGIKTYVYDAPFSPDPFIQEINITPCSDDVYKPEGYRIYMKTHKGSNWQCLAQVGKDEKGNYQLFYKKKNASGTYSKLNFTGKEKPIIKARYIKVQVDPKAYSKVFTSDIEQYDGGYQIYINDDFTNVNASLLQGLEAKIDGNGLNPGSQAWDAEFAQGLDSHNRVKIINAALIDNDTIRISLNRVLSTNTHDSKIKNSQTKHTITFRIYGYSGGIQTFSVNGTQFKTQQGVEIEGDKNNPLNQYLYLTMTDDFEEYNIYYSTGQSGYELPFTPTYIHDVFVSTLTGVSVTLEEVNDMNKLEWKTQKKSFTSSVYNNKTNRFEKKEFIYYKIVSGNYYYDPWDRKIYLPSFNQQNPKIHIADFEKNVFDLKGFTSYIPSVLSLIYYDGNGKSITLPATARGRGPSYMIEKGAITKISSGAIDKDIYGTCSMVDVNGNEKKLSAGQVEWVCCNNEPSTLSIESQSNSYHAVGSVTNFNAGQFRPPSFTGKQIHNLSDSTKAAQAFIDLYGKHAQNVIGTCETKVTFTGPPNSILSGDIIVTAPAETTYSIDIGGGKKLKYYERTGGLARGFIVCYCKPVSNKGRATVCYQIPTLLIYAKERNPYKIEQ